MNHSDKLQKLKQDFPDEASFRIFLIDLLKKMGFKDVQHTHRYGSPEEGKDIIGKQEHHIDGTEWYAFVVKHGHIGGGTQEVETIKGQIAQSFEYPYLTVNGDSINVKKVKVVNNENITKGAQESIGKSPSLKLLNNYEFWYCEPLIEKIDKYFPEFWLPGDLIPKEYSITVNARLKAEFEIKELSVEKLTPTKVQKLMELFIDPSLVEFTTVTDKDSKKIVKPVKFNLKQIAESKDSFTVTGDPGAGKSRFLNKLVTYLLDPDIITKQNIYPVKIGLQVLRESDFDIKASVYSELKKIIPDHSSNLTFENTSFTILLDSVDDLFKEELEKLVNNIKPFIKEHKHRFIITARNIDDIEFGEDSKKIRRLNLRNFNEKQVEAFILKYFENENRGRKFIEVLKESNILSKLPTTPLTITLMSLLYEENDYEIPATVTDIYDDFSSVLLGKLDIKNKVSLLEFKVKRRIFSFIALKMLEEKKFEITFDFFKEEANNFLKAKGFQEQTDEELSRIIKHSGVLYIDEHGKVGFKHLSFLEFFASIEIYDAQRTHYKKLIENFNDVNWQNTAIFYAGRSKDMPDFVDELIEGMPNKDMRDWLVNSGGLGYLSQALYMTDVKYKRKLVAKSLDNILLVFYEIKKLSAEKGGYYGLQLPVIAVMLSYWFNLNFKSITLTGTLTTEYDSLIENNTDELSKTNLDLGLKLFLVASTLAHKYINDLSKFEDLLSRDCFFKDPVLMVAADIFMELGEMGSNAKVEGYKERLDKQIDTYRKVIVGITKEPAYRFDDDYHRKKKEDKDEEETKS